MEREARLRLGAEASPLMLKILLPKGPPIDLRRLRQSALGRLRVGFSSAASIACRSAEKEPFSGKGKALARQVP